MILVVGLSNDKTILHTVHTMQKLQIPYIFFDIHHFMNEGKYFWDSSCKEGYISYSDVKVEFPNEEITGIYVRLIDLSIYYTGTIKQNMQTKLWSLTKILHQTNILTINKPLKDISNFSKIYHLNLLSKCGFNTPPSLLTNDANEANNFIKEHKEVIYKGASSAKTIVSQYNSDLQKDIHLIGNSPVLFQKRVNGVDVRTHLIGNKCFSEAIQSDAIDYRFNKGKNEFYSINLPNDLINKCQNYRKLSGLDFIGFDFLLTEAGEYIILEANPMPGYEGYDRRANFKISKSLVSVLNKGSMQE